MSWQRRGLPKPLELVDWGQIACRFEADMTTTAEQHRCRGGSIAELAVFRL